MSELSIKHAGHKVSEVSPQDLRYIIVDLITDAVFLMSAGLDKDYKDSLIGWTYKFLNEHFSFLPITHVCKAIEAGSMGQRGGTSKLMPRNIAIWLNEQRSIYETQCMEIQKRQDLQHITENQRKYVCDKDGFVGAAVRIKVGWYGDKKITSQEYDSFSSSEIYKLLKAGVKECNIRPSDILKNR